MNTTRRTWRVSRGAVLAAALCLALAPLLTAGAAAPAIATRARAAVVAADTTPAPGTAQLVLRHRADAPVLDVEVTSMATAPWVTTGPRALASGQEMTIDVALWPNAGWPSGFQPGQVQVEAWQSGATYQFLLVQQDLLLQSGQHLVLDISGPVPTTKAPSQNCPPAGVIPPAGAANALSADLDGDGTDERVVLWSETAGTWLLGATGLGSGNAIATVTPTSAGAEPKLMGATNVDDRTGEEVFVATGRDGPLEQFQMFGLRGCTLKVTTDLDGNTMTLLVGSSETRRAGVRSQYSDLNAELHQWRGEGGSYTFTMYLWTDELSLNYAGGPSGGPGPGTDPEPWVVNHASNLRVGVPTLRLLTPEGQPPPPPDAPAPPAPAPTPVTATPSYTG